MTAVHRVISYLALFWLLFGIYIKTFNVFCQKHSQENFARKFERCYRWSKLYFKFDFKEKKKPPLHVDDDVINVESHKIHEICLKN